MSKRAKQWLLEEKYHGLKNNDFENDLRRLERGEPVDYVIGHTEFLGVPIDLSFRPLIPRNETEFWVDLLLKKWKVAGTAGPRTFLDIFSIGLKITNKIITRIKFIHINLRCLTDMYTKAIP